MASFGMMGALGGLGASLQNEASIMQKEEEATAADARRTKLEQWLMTAREEIAVRAEGRADARDVAKEGRARVAKREDDEYAHGKKVERAPVEREIKTADERASAEGKLGFETDNIDKITGNKKAIANASQSDADVALKGEQAKFYGGKTEALGDKPGGGKMSEVDKIAYTDKISEAKRLDEKHENMRLDGSWQGTPEQLKSEAKVIALRRQAREIANRYAGDAPPAADPQGLRTSKPEGAPAKPGMMGPTNAGERGMKASVDELQGADPRAVDREIAATTADLKKVSDPASRAELEKHLADLQKVKVSLGAKPAPAAPASAPATAAEPAAPIDPTEMLGREVDSARDEFRTFTEPSKRPGLAAGASARQEYATKVESLKAKMKAAESRYQRAVGGTTAAFNVARP